MLFKLVKESLLGKKKGTKSHPEILSPRHISTEFQTNPYFPLEQILTFSKKELRNHCNNGKTKITRMLFKLLDHMFQICNFLMTTFFPNARFNSKIFILVWKLSYSSEVTLNIHQCKYTPEEGQSTRLPEIACAIVNIFLQIYISRM